MNMQETVKIYQMLDKCYEKSVLIDFIIAVKAGADTWSVYY